MTIITRLVSGLGNQLFQYALGRDLTIQRKQEKLKFDVSFYKDQKLRVFSLNSFNINGEIATSGEIANFTQWYSGKKLINKAYRRFEQFLPKYKRLYYKEDNPWGYEPELSKISANTYIDGYWQNYRYYENLDPIIFKELSLKNNLLLNVQNLVFKMKNCQSVSVHIRRGDYITDSEANNLMGVLPTNYYQNAIQLIKNQVENPIFFFFSDDINWVKKNYKNIENNIFVEGYKDFEDLILMSNCEHNIIANSSFSWWGAFLNKNPCKIVIGPKKWVLNCEVNNRIELLFPSWVSI